MVSTLPSAPAATARAMKASGSSQNTSIRAEGIPRFVGLSQPLFAGSPTKKGAPAISSPATDPRFHSSTAPSARMYHATASGALGTATITEIRGGFAKLSCRRRQLQGDKREGVSTLLPPAEQGG